MKLSIIVPVYNRPDEIRELLHSLTAQTDNDFEVLIVEDGSTLKCEDVCNEFANRLKIRYFFKENSGRSNTRNYGMQCASGNYFLIFDSDCIMPQQYIATVRKCLADNYVDCFGGPDAADVSFSDVQKAISYAMTSFFTTGGIRGGMKNSQKFSPRSFNMGISKTLFEKIGAFKNMIGEDIDFSYRVKQAGFKTMLFKDAFVYHKRRVGFKKFYRQVNTFGKARVVLNKLHKGLLKAVHLLPTAFVLGHFLLISFALIFQNLWFLLPIPLFVLLIFTDACIKTKSAKIAFLSVIASYMQLFGYGLGMLNELFTHKAQKRTQEELYR